MAQFTMYARSICGGTALLLAVSASAGTMSVPESIDNYLSARYTADAPGAAVIVVKEGKVIFRKGYGLADLELKTPLRPEMVFRLASVTKQFTAVAIMMLAEQGKLALADDVRRFIPDYPVAAGAVTIERLLNHTAGVPGFSDDYLAKRDMRADITPAQILELIKAQPSEFAPGTKWGYSDGGYELLGMIIEKASGQTYADFVEQRIFKPLGMQHSHYDRSERIIANRVKGYAQTPAGYQNAAYLSMTLPYAAGSLASSVDDLALWDAAIADGDKLIGAESRRRMLVSYVLPQGAAGVMPYGLGMGLMPRRNETRVHHNGQINGFTTAVLRLPKDKVYVAVLTNLENPKIIPDLIAERVAAIAAGKPYPEQATVQLSPQDLDKFVGNYQMDAKNMRVVSRDGKRLFMQRNAGRKLELHPVSANGFIIQDAFSEVNFGAENGNVNTLTMTQMYGPANVARRVEK